MEVPGSLRRRLVKFVERDLYLAVEQPARSLVAGVDPVEALDIHPQLDETAPGRVRHVPPELTHSRHAAHRFRHPTENVEADRHCPHAVICSNHVNQLTCTSSDFRQLQFLHQSRHFTKPFRPHRMHYTDAAYCYRCRT